MLPAHLAALDDLKSAPKERHDQAYSALMNLTAGPVPWAYDIWDELVTLLADPDNRRRSIASQVLANLAKSDPENRMLRDFPALLDVTRDPRFVTARHCLQSLGRVAIVSPQLTRLVVDGLALRFAESYAEKNGTLIRYDITELYRQIHDRTGDSSIRAASQALIATETDPKYQKKFASVWKRK